MNSIILEGGDLFWCIVIATFGYGLLCLFVATTMFSILKMMGQIRTVYWLKEIRSHWRTIWLWIGILSLIILIVTCYIQLFGGFQTATIQPDAARIFASLVALEIAIGSFWVSGSITICMSNLGLTTDQVNVVRERSLSFVWNLISGTLFATSGICLFYPGVIKMLLISPIQPFIGGFADTLLNPIFSIYLALFSIGYGNRIMLHIGLAAVTTKSDTGKNPSKIINDLRQAKQQYFSYALLALATYCTSLLAVPHIGVSTAINAWWLFAVSVFVFVFIFFLIHQTAIRNRIRQLHEKEALNLKTCIFSLIKQPNKASANQVENLRMLLSIQMQIASHDIGFLDFKSILPMVSSVVLPIIINFTEVHKFINSLFP